MALTRGRVLRLLALALCSICIVSAAPGKRALLPLPPNVDPFYEPPAGYQNEANGAVLRSRIVVSSFLGLVPAADVITYQLLYRTQAVNGSAIAGVTTVFRPLLSPKLDRFVSFQTAYDGSALVCDPSYSYQLGAAQVDLITDSEFLLLEAYLSEGYIVSAPDYEGPDAAFGAGRLAGTGVLDSMRAVRNFHQTLGMTTDNPAIVAQGYSGGAIATGWAASLQPTYASELPIKGWACGGTPANVTGTAVFIDGTAFAGFLPASINGLQKPSAYGAQLKALIASIVTPYGEFLLDFANNNCVANLAIFFEQYITSTKVQSLGDQLFYQPAIAGVLAQQTMGVSANITPTAPVYMYHAVPDEVIPYSNASTLYHAWCGYGAEVNFVTFANGGHLTTEILGFPGAFDFVKKAFAGNVGFSGCIQSTVLNNTLNPIALGASLEPITSQLINVLGKLGREDINVISNLNVLNETVST